MFAVECASMHRTYREFNYTSQDGLSLFCRDYAPSAPRGTVVCLHGLTRNSRDFGQLAEHLARRYRVLVPDLRGRGHSQWDAKLENYHAKVYCNDILKLITEEVQGRTALIGTSLGGIIAMLLGASSADRIAGIVVNDIGPELASTGATRISGYVGVRESPGTWAAAAAQIKAAYANAYPDFDDAMWMSHAKATHRELDDGRVVADYDPKIGDAVRATSSRKFDLWEVWRAIGVPVLAIRGGLSDLLSAGTFERMLREKPDLARIEVPNRGHAPVLTEPLVLPAIDQFLGRVFAVDQ
jgi:pimeloyl-ACP methyl ester carboxylesterase